MSNPKIKIPLDGIDIVIESLSAAALLLLLIYPAYYYGQLPEYIPSHFNVSGDPDDFSSKGSIWFLVTIGAFSYVLFLVLGKFPYLYNYAKKITEQNAEGQYRIATKMMRLLNLIILLMFCYITFQTIQTALNQADGLGSGFLIVSLGATGIITTIYLVMAFKSPSDTSSGSLDSE